MAQRNRTGRKKRATIAPEPATKAGKRTRAGDRRTDRRPPGSPLAAGSTLPEHVIVAETKAEYHPAAARAAGAAETVSEAEHRDHIVEVELASGGRFFTRFDQFVADFGGGATRGAAPEGQFAIPAALVGPTAERGIGEWAIRTLRFIGIDPIDAAAKLTGEKVSAWYEAKQLYREDSRGDAEQRLWRVGDGDALSLVGVATATASDSPLLVFLHGTASSTRGSFGELWATNARDVRKAILGPYGKDNVYAFEHRSLTQSPMQNALALLDQLPTGARLHVVSHSRGGLVGELLCRGQMVGRDAFEEEEIKRLFSDGKRKSEADDLRLLNRRLKEKKLRVERFVRVACPARGTILVSERLDRWLSVSLDAIGTIADLATSGYYAVFEEFVKAFVKTRTDPGALPGLEAMMPTSPIVQLLNRADVKTSADLHVIAGDIEGGDIWRRLGILLTDLYYREDHDLVVNTRAMYGGTPRVEVPRRFFAQGPQVYHFTYFRNPATAAKVADGLHKPLQQDGYDAFDQQVPAPPRGYRAPVPAARGDTAVAKPIVFVLPGIMGSCLDANGERIWVDVPAINRGDMGRLAIDGANVTPTALIEESYGALLGFLGRTHDVVPFPFDWRVSLRSEAERLAMAATTWLDEADRRGQPLALIAHSLGGLLARVMIADHPELWERIVAKPQGRLVMLGTPNGGSHAIPLMLLGREPIVQGLALVDFRHSQRELIQLIGRYPGVLELLPAHAADDFFDADLWKRLALLDDNGRAYWAPPDATALHDARTVRTMLDRSTPHLDRVVYVAGHAPRTPCQLRLDRPPESNVQSDGSMRLPENFYFESTAEGDGRVPWATGILPGLRPWYMDAVHGDLAATPEHFDAVLDLVSSGTTDKLPTTPPAAAKRGGAMDVYRSEPVPYVPDAEALEASAVGRGRRKKVPAAAAPVIEVSVAHGNLVFARAPVFVGHYKADSITSAEAQIDSRLRRRLTAHYRLGLYPGPLGTVEVFWNASTQSAPGLDFPGAVVFGLGDLGELSPAMLTSTFAHAAIAYAVERIEAGATSDSSAPIEAKIASLLIGTGWKAMAVRDSVVAILRAVVHANDELARSPYAGRVRIGEITFIELYEDVAIQAAHALTIAAVEADLVGRIDVAPELRAIEGGRTRAYFSDEGSWWHRLQIVAQPDGSLKFTLLTDRARAESTLQATQRALVAQFVARQITTTASDDRLAVTLFELMVPNRLKEHAPEGRDLVLLLDGEAASYPWELMQDGGAAPDANGGERPDPFRLRLALRAGLIRQLQTEAFRETVTNATGTGALVVGDPQSDPAIFPELVGAQREASAVAKALSDGGFDVVPLFQPRPEGHAIVGALFARPYRVLHLAGHGVFDYAVPLTPEEKRRVAAGESIDPRRVSGMVLGVNVFLTAVEIAQMRQVPEVVFVNCCHLGRATGDEDAPTRDRHRLAANLATQLIRIGVKVVVAAGWAVDDGAAELFARTFYEQMLAGVAFGRAVLAARRMTARDFPQSNTWGAYQCYGDYEYRLTSAATPATGSGIDDFAGPTELVIALQNLASDALTSRAADLQWLDRRLDELVEFVRRHRSGWIGDARVCAAFGQALGEVDRFEDALTYYAKAIAAERATLSVRALEQSANLLTRAAVAQWREAAAKPPAPPLARQRALAKIDHGIGVVEHLLEFARTPERLSILGSAHKRRALLVETAVERNAALREMSKNYRAAHELAISSTGAIDAYPLLNWLSAEACLRPQGVGAAQRTVANDLLDKVDRQLADSVDIDFWGLVTRADLILVRSLLGGTLGVAERQDLLQAYRAVSVRAGSPRQLRSVIEQLDFLAQMYGQSRAASVKSVAAQIRMAADELQSETETPAMAARTPRGRAF
jgi:hypothetical protein